MRTRAAFLVAALLLLGASSGRAALTASLSASVQNSASGQTLLFCGTLVNSSATDELFLNGIQFALSGTAAAAIVSGSNAFYANVPGILLPGESYTGEIFSVTLSGSAPPVDYSGAVTLQGGADIFAASGLATEPFTVLSPAVTIVATSSSASEVGPVSGAFTITRTGGTEIGLPVSFAIGGTGVNGSDYQAIATSVTIASGSSSAVIAITPIPNDIAQANPTAVLTLATSTLYNPGLATTGAVTIQVKPADAWRFETFGSLANSPQAADTADWGPSGIANLTAFALNINPVSPNPALLPTPAVLSGYPTLTYHPNPAATDVTYSVEASTDLINWSTAAVQSASNPNSAPPGSVTFRYINPIGAPGCVFMRLRLTRTDQ
jgi:hypothetical protein